jgi:hypothetical protein
MEQPSVEPAKKPRKPPSEWKKTPRMKSIRDKAPDFIGKAELAHHLQCHISTIDTWIEEGRIPPPHSRPGEKHPVWLRKHYEVYKGTGSWPRESRRS